MCKIHNSTDHDKDGKATRLQGMIHKGSNSQKSPYSSDRGQGRRGTSRHETPCEHPQLKEGIVSFFFSKSFVEINLN